MDKKILEKMLALKEMRVKTVTVDFEEKVLHVSLEWKKKNWNCSSCGAEKAAWPIKTEPRKHPVRHLNCFEFKTLLYFDNVEMKCSNCGALFNRRPSFLGDSHFLTVSLLEDWMTKAKGTSVRQVAKWNNEPERTFTELYFRQLRLADSHRSLPTIRHLGIDEISLLKGRSDYVLLLYDLDVHEVIDILPDRKKETLKAYLTDHRDDMFSQLRVACTDMWSPYKDAVLAVFPNVDVVADRFHVEKQLNEALDDFRKEIQSRIVDPERRRKWKKEYRHVLLRAKEKQLRRPNGQAELEEVLNQSSGVKRMYNLKESFRGIFKLKDPKVALHRLNKWLRRASYFQSKHLSSFIKTVKRWKKEILAYIVYRITNGISEGLNCKVKLFKRMGYGFRNFGNFRLRILHTCSKSFI